MNLLPIDVSKKPMIYCRICPRCSFGGAIAQVDDLDNGIFCPRCGFRARSLPEDPRYWPECIDYGEPEMILHIRDFEETKFEVIDHLPKKSSQLLALLIGYFKEDVTYVAWYRPGKGLKVLFGIDPMKEKHNEEPTSSSD